jgi:predicted CopG family antitoxin
LPNNPKETSKESKKNSSINEKAYRMLKEMHERFPDTVSEVMTLQKKTLFRKQMCTYD